MTDAPSASGLGWVRTEDLDRVLDGLKRHGRLAALGGLDNYTGARTVFVQALNELCEEVPSLGFETVAGIAPVGVYADLISRLPQYSEGVVRVAIRASEDRLTASCCAEYVAPAEKNFPTSNRIRVEIMVDDGAHYADDSGIVVMHEQRLIGVPSLDRPRPLQVGPTYKLKHLRDAGVTGGHLLAQRLSEMYGLLVT